MNDKKITLILGAGASLPYGFPSGPDLIDKIANTSLRPPDNGLFHEESYNKFRQALKESGANSVDWFLNERNDLSTEGKCAIGHHIITSEGTGRVFPSTHASRDWYPFFFAEFFKSKIQIENATRILDIITFNYDRSLEYFVQRMFKARLGCSDDEAFSFLYKNIRIFHVYGRLPPLPNEAKFLPIQDDVIEIPFQSSVADPKIHDFLSQYSVQNLKTIWESKHQQHNYKNTLENSDHILVLGTAYHKENMDLLGYDFTAPPRAKRLVQGTAYTNSGRHFDYIRNTFHGIETHKLTVLEMIRERVLV